MRVANCKRERIGRIFRLGQHWQLQEKLDHLLHLLLACRAIADDGEFGFFRSILENGYPSSRCSNDHDTTGHPQFKCALHIFINKLRFNSNSIGGVLIEKFFQTVEESQIARRKIQICRWTDASKIHRLDARMTNSDHPVARDARSRIDS